MANRRGKLINLRVAFLDGTLYSFQVPVKADGYCLWDAVVNHLQLVEYDYFDLEYINKNNVVCWLDKEKLILKQLPSLDTPLRFCVKFYVQDPSLLQDEYTRYIFAQQVKRDLAIGNIPCNETTAARLASYIVQAEIGDFLEEEYVDHSYLSSMKLLPVQTPDMEQIIMEYHKDLIGESPSEAELGLLDTVRKVELYGLRFIIAKDHEGTTLNLAVSHPGILVFHNQIKLNTFSWAVIRKLSFKRRKFLIKFLPDSWGSYGDVVEFYFISRDECKAFWKWCIENYTFFRCDDIRHPDRNKRAFVSRGSSFRYCGRTQRQLSFYMRSSSTKAQQFHRSSSSQMSTRSASTTPRIHAKSGTLNSSMDFHASQNSTMSSGSHTFDVNKDHPPASSHLPESEMSHIHSDSFLAAPASVSPTPNKFQHSYSIDEERLLDNGPVSDRNHILQNHDLTSSGNRLDPPFYAVEDRKFSEPALNTKFAQHLEFEQRLSHCDEVVNIPETIEETSRVENGHHFYSSYREPQSEELSILKESNFSFPPPPSPLQTNGELTNDTTSSPVLPDPLVTNYANGNYSQALRLVGKDATSSKTSISAKTEDSFDDVKRKQKRHISDQSYYIAKELLMTERTYLKNLEVLTLWFRNAMAKKYVMPNFLMDLMFVNLDPIYDSHVNMLKDIDNRITMWESMSIELNGECQKVGDVILKNLSVLEYYKNYIQQIEGLLIELEATCSMNKPFDAAYKEFEREKVCYLPLNTFLLKPSHRLFHYKILLEKLVSFYTAEHPDTLDCKVALMKISEVINTYRETIFAVENTQKLIELQRDIIGVDNLVVPERRFLREGCLQKFSRKGYQQRMFFLFSDVLLYTSRMSTPLMQFKVHGQLPLKEMTIEDRDKAKMDVDNSFAIYGGNRCLMVATGGPEEKDKWIEDLADAIDQANCSIIDIVPLNTSKISYSSENVDLLGHEGDVGDQAPSLDVQINHRANTTMQVCWHRNTSVSASDQVKAIRNQLSGYLLRKFKKSSGWQKLWVVFTNFCLFFYKTYQDDFPLASLPLLGYSVSSPTPEDAIHKDHVFKLQFKNHIYFFRAESEYTYERWVEVINCATSSAARTRVFSRLESFNQ